MPGKLNPHVSVDCVIFGFDSLSLKILLIDRNYGQHLNKNNTPLSLKLPGSLVYDDEDIDTAAVRVLKDLTGLNNIYLQQLYVFGSPNRLNKKGDLDWLQSLTKMKINRVVTVAYYSLIKLEENKKTYPGASWCDVTKLPDLAFDHAEIIQKGLIKLRRELHYEPIEFELLPKKFTIRQIQTLYEIILGKKLDGRNFRKKIIKLGYILQVTEKEKNVSHKPAQYYRFKRKNVFKVTKKIF
jgi:hypothetical protein